MLFKLLLLLCTVGAGVNGHGRLIEPPSRSTMWRYGFDTPPNYNDHELYCGGFSRQWDTNGGKCGICGDPWDAPQPRDNEAGGKFGRGVITRRYRKNQLIKVRIELTANHMGHFEFRMCPNNNPKRVAPQTCLDRYILRKADGEPNYYPGPGTKVFEMYYRLPKDLTCSQCVFQWRYIAGNSWGTCKNGTGTVGCGPQEEFRACSDVSIFDEDGSTDTVPNMDIDETEDYNEVESDWRKDHGANTDEEEESVEQVFMGHNIAIIILATLLTAFIMFCAVFFYYYKAKVALEKFIDDKGLEFPSLPSMPNMPKFSKLRKMDVRSLCRFEKLGSINWPLSNISLSDKLPSFIQKSSSVRTVSSVPSAAIRTVSAPVPPPRTKRTKSRPSSPSPTQPRLATIQPRPHPRPPAPPPAMPNRPPAPILDISAPTEVTINGVTFKKPSPMSNTAAGPTPSSSGVICSARPAVVMADLPDSSLEISMTASQPPPLPTCPPPESLTDVDMNDNCTDA